MPCIAFLISMLKLTLPTRSLVSRLNNVMEDGERESFVLNLVSREAITNETVRVGKKFTTEEPISASVREILEDQKYLSTDKINIIEDTQNNYGFIGNMKKPFTVITCLASKSVSGGSENQPKDGTAGFLFYETKDGFNFRSIDKLIEEGTQKIKSDASYKTSHTYFYDGVLSNSAENDFKILIAGSFRRIYPEDKRNPRNRKIIMVNPVTSIY